MNEDLIKATLEKDVTSLNNTEKQRLTGDCYIAGKDVFSKKAEQKKL